jgi:hypothetical protein
MKLSWSLVKRGEEKTLRVPVAKRGKPSNSGGFLEGVIENGSEWHERAWSQEENAMWRCLWWVLSLGFDCVLAFQASEATVARKVFSSPLSVEFFSQALITTLPRKLWNFEIFQVRVKSSVYCSMVDIYSTTYQNNTAIRYGKTMLWWRPFACSFVRFQDVPCIRSRCIHFSLGCRGWGSCLLERQCNHHCPQPIIAVSLSFPLLTVVIFKASGEIAGGGQTQPRYFYIKRTRRPSRRGGGLRCCTLVIYITSCTDAPLLFI